MLCGEACSYSLCLELVNTSELYKEWNVHADFTIVICDDIHTFSITFETEASLLQFDYAKHLGLMHRGSILLKLTVEILVWKNFVLSLLSRTVSNAGKPVFGTLIALLYNGVPVRFNLVRSFYCLSLNLNKSSKSISENIFLQ